MARHNGGWVKVYRDLLESDVGSNGNRLAIFVTLLMWANWEEGTIEWRGTPRIIPAGAGLLGYDELSKKLECSKSTIDRQLKYLVKRGTITLEVCKKGTLFFINNFAKYQSNQDTPEHRQNDDEYADRTMTSTVAEPHEEYKKERTKNTRKRGEYSTSFEEIYKSYPRREGKSAAYKTYQREILTLEDEENLKAAVARYAARKRGKDPQYLLMFSTFMNQWRDWLDEDAGLVRQTSQKLQPRDLEAL